MDDESRLMVLCTGGCLELWFQETSAAMRPSGRVGPSGPALLGLRTNWGAMVGVGGMVTCGRISRETGEVKRAAQLGS